MIDLLPTGCWTRGDVELGDYFLRDGKLFKVLAIADSPTVELIEVVSGKTENHVIHSPLFATFKRLRPERP